MHYTHLTLLLQQVHLSGVRNQLDALESAALDVDFAFRALGALATLEKDVIRNQG